MKEIFFYDPVVEAKRLIFTYYQIKTGFYLNKGFRISTNQEKADSNTILIPKLDSSLSDKIWRNISYSLLYHYSGNLITELTEYLSQNNHLVTAKEIRTIRELWFEKSPIFWKKIRRNFTPEISFTSPLKIMIARFGSLGSFPNPFDPSYMPPHFYLALRFNSGPHTLAQIILLFLYYPLTAKLSFNWYQLKSLVDFILENDYLKDLFNFDYPEKISYTHRSVFDQEEINDFQEKIKKDTQKLHYRTFTNFLRYQQNLLNKGQKNLFYAQKERPLPQIQSLMGNVSIEKNNLYYQGKEIEHDFTSQEIEVLKSLVSAQDQTVCLDEIAQKIWQENVYTKYSPWAISSLIYRLRKKLNVLGLKKIEIETIKNQGFQLKVTD